MIHFPVLETIKIENYGLFSAQADHTLSISFKTGSTLILGANGLGKTTLITILYRMLTGPYELPMTALQSRELGGASLAPRELGKTERSTFANRVFDGAKDAIATLSIKFGDETVIIQRRLKDLSLIKMSVGDSTILKDEKEFQETICRLAGVWFLGDWLLILRHLIFYFEDRRELVWDSSAQRQLLRILFLPADVAQQWYKDEREILSLDTRVRNDNAALSRLRKNVILNERKQQKAGDVKAELESLEEIQSKEEEKLDRLVEKSSELDSLRNKLRLELLINEQERENIIREIERARLLAIHSQFPSDHEVGQYLLAQFIVDGKCSVCSRSAEELARVFSERLDMGECVLCGNKYKATGQIIGKPELARERLEELTGKRVLIDSRLDDIKNELTSINNDYLRTAEEIEKLRVLRDEREQRIAILLNALPKEDERIRKSKEELSVLQRSVNEQKARVTVLGEAFKLFVNQFIDDIRKHSDKVKETFHDYAEGFLLEECELKWSLHLLRIGQLGVQVNFPAFELDMSGVDFPVLVRRSNPEQVSESQREFIDLSFRMALISVVGGEYGGSILMDAPESSLDGVFVERAADVLSRFGLSGSNRLVITSNLVQGDLIPAILRKTCPPYELSDCLVNLLRFAVPTAAVREKRSEYEKLLNDILKQGGQLQ